MKFLQKQIKQVGKWQQMTITVLSNALAPGNGWANPILNWLIY